MQVTGHDQMQFVNSFFFFIHSTKHIKVTALSPAVL